MKIGIDYHGVINANPDFFKDFCKQALNQKLEIFVISGGSRKDVETYLKEHDILYSDIFSLLDYFKEKNMVTFYEDGSFFVPNDLWNRAKANYCFKNNIAVHIDDSLIYGAYFNTPFCLYSLAHEHCTFIKKNIAINFEQPAKKVLEDILSAL